MSTEVLGGDLKAHFAYGSIEEQAAALEAARFEQSQMAGYEVMVASTRQTHYVDADGKDVYEIWATFKPVPPAEPIQPKLYPLTDGTQA
jgi:hypothetical protein